MKIFFNFVPNTVITINNREPRWMMDFLKSKIQWQNSVTRIYQRATKTTVNYETLQQAVTEVSELISENREFILQTQTSRPTSSKTYWSMQKTSYNNKSYPWFYHY